MAKGHPSTDLITSYATGGLPAAPSLTVAVHAETCPECEGRIAKVEQEYGELLSGLPDSDLSPSALDRILKRIEEDSPEIAAQLEVSRLGDARLPAALAGFDLTLRRWLMPGVWVSHVRAPRTERWRAYLVRAEANAALPTHAHRGLELISVLQGAYDDGRRYAAGDFVQYAASTEHRQQVTQDGPCLALVAAQRPARWRGTAKFIAPMFGI